MASSEQLRPVGGMGAGTTEARVAHVRERANWMRRRLLGMIVDAGQGHPGGDLSATDIVASLYFDILRIDPSNASAPERDRFVMSKGHCTGALYAALAGAGFFAEAELDTYLKPLSRLNGHPNRTYLPGVETNTGPLGHGFPVGVGIAVAGQIDGSEYRVFVLTGDGELQEGSMWEAAMFAGHRGLGKLTVIVDRNRLQQGAGTEDTNQLEPLGDKWRAFGWDVVEVDGHDPAALLAAFDDTAAPRDRPRCIIANTIKGKGVSFMENQAGWHHGVPNAAQYAQALAELSA
ncbi:transketolase [Sphingomonas sp. NFR15]|uniref:transketolase n=1 Tax=Sphingomonas sp. NFR15 TaxID=1566282 RepID=UPI00088C87BF|nr:transketolase [Sphingomonas sp. NFR15]SDA15633.1 transketolase [Sphingomonas sp. NFR15]